MSKKHFIEFAHAVSNIKDIGERERTARMIASVCLQFNGAFDAARFYTACGVEI